MSEKCSYCGRPLGNRFSFGFSTTPTIFKCKRWWCTLLKKIGIYKLTYKTDL